jgi:hypothetical protein
MLAARSLRRVMQVCWPQSIAGSTGVGPPFDFACQSRGNETYTVDQATNVKWFEGGVPRYAWFIPLS